MADDTNTSGQQPNPAADGATPNAGGQQEPQPNGAAESGEGGEGQGPKATAADGAPNGEGKTGETGDPKPADKAGEGDGKNGEGQAEGAPESYETFTVPEGFTLEGERLSKFQELARASNWTQEQAQQVINDFTTNVHEDLKSQHAATVERWAEDLKADPQFGGANYESNLQVAGAAVARFGGQELIDLLNDYGIGNHPVLNKTFLKIGQQTSEGGLPGMGSPQGAAPKSLGERMYPNMTQK